jgi:murein DD-endopeptidase MepM/ murein hydrolase activator NlpD
MKRASYSQWLIAWGTIGSLLLPVVALGQADSHSEPTAASQIAKRIRDKQPNGFAQAMALGEKAVEPLTEILFDKSLSTPQRFMAANILGDIRSRKAVEPLVSALKDDEFNVRRCAALALGKIGDASARPALERLAKEDPFAWTEPKSGKVMYLVHEDAQKALDMLDGKIVATPQKESLSSLVKEPEIFLDDASKMPPSPVKVDIRQLPWPFAGGFRENNVWNNYQQPTDIYIHAGLDLIQKVGLEVRAVEGGYIAGISTNYPDWKTHTYFVVSRQKDGNEGWCYTHVDPDSYSFKVGDEIKQGQVLGKLVDFYVGKNKGADHLHLHYVRFNATSNGKLDVQSLVDPLLFFSWEDTAAPRIQAPLRFVRKGTLDEWKPGSDGVATVSGRVEVIAGISDSGYEGQACNWMVPVVTLEIAGENGQAWRKLVLDQRGEISKQIRPLALYLSREESLSWSKTAPRFPTVFYLKATSTDGDGLIEEADRLQAWDTTEQSAAGGQRFPDGLYTVTLRAWDLKGNRAEQSTRVRVANKPATPE